MKLNRLLTRGGKKQLKKELKVQEKVNLEIRDSLAMQRTKMANERTLLSYLRSAIAMILPGLTFIKLFDDMLYIGLGLLAIPLGIFVAYYGYRRFLKQKQEIAHHAETYTPISPVLAEVVAQDKEEPRQ